MSLRVGVIIYFLKTGVWREFEWLAMVTVLGSWNVLVSRLMWFQRGCSVPVSDCLCIGYWILVQLNILILLPALPVLILGLPYSLLGMWLCISLGYRDDGGCKYLVMLLSRHSSFRLPFVWHRGHAWACLGFLNPERIKFQDQQGWEPDSGLW